MRELKFKLGDFVTASDTLRDGSKCEGLVTGQVVEVRTYADCPYGIMFIEHKRMHEPRIRAHTTVYLPYYVYESSIKLKANPNRKVAVACDLFK